MFNPHIFNIKDETAETYHNSTICAVGSQDNGISVWCTQFSRAIVGVQNIFTQSVMDMCWNPDGLSLYACSYDGTIALIQFDTNEFGQKLSDSARIQAMGSYSTSAHHIIPESIEQLNLEAEMRNNMETDKFDDRIGDVQAQIVIEDPKSPNVPINVLQPILDTKDNLPTINVKEHQKVTITKDGKKRIQPVFLSSLDDSISVAPAQPKRRRKVDLNESSPTMVFFI